MSAAWLARSLRITPQLLASINVIARVVRTDRPKSAKFALRLLRHRWNTGIIPVRSAEWLKNDFIVSIGRRRKTKCSLSFFLTTCDIIESTLKQVPFTENCGATIRLLQKY